MRSAVVTIFWLLLAGCAMSPTGIGGYTANKPGITAQQKSADLYQCMKENASAVSEFEPAGTASVRMDDATGAMVMACMAARGYSFTAN
jgi:hypothetical protein